MINYSGVNIFNLKLLILIIVVWTFLILILFSFWNVFFSKKKIWEYTLDTQIPFSYLQKKKMDEK